MSEIVRGTQFWSFTLSKCARIVKNVKKRTRHTILVIYTIKVCHEIKKCQKPHAAHGFVHLYYQSVSGSKNVRNRT